MTEVLNIKTSEIVLKPMNKRFILKPIFDASKLEKWFLKRMMKIEALPGNK